MTARLGSTTILVASVLRPYSHLEVGEAPTAARRYGVGWRWWPAAPIALPGVLLSLAWRIETGGIGGGDGRSDLVHPLRTAGGVGLRRVLMCSPMLSELCEKEKFAARQRRSRCLACARVSEREAVKITAPLAGSIAPPIAITTRQLIPPARPRPARKVSSTPSGGASRARENDRKHVNAA